MSLQIMGGCGGEEERQRTTFDGERASRDQSALDLLTTITLPAVRSTSAQSNPGGARLIASTNAVYIDPTPLNVIFDLDGLRTHVRALPPERQIASLAGGPTQVESLLPRNMRGEPGVSILRSLYRQLPRELVIDGLAAPVPAQDLSIWADERLPFESVVELVRAAQRLEGQSVHVAAYVDEAPVFFRLDRPDCWEGSTLSLVAPYCQYRTARARDRSDGTLNRLQPTTLHVVTLSSGSVEIAQLHDEHRPTIQTVSLNDLASHLRSWRQIDPRRFHVLVRATRAISWRHGAPAIAAAIDAGYRVFVGHASVGVSE